MVARPQSHRYPTAGGPARSAPSAASRASGSRFRCDCSSGRQNGSAGPRPEVRRRSTRCPRAGSGWSPSTPRMPPAPRRGTCPANPARHPSRAAPAPARRRSRPLRTRATARAGRSTGLRRCGRRACGPPFSMRARASLSVPAGSATTGVTRGPVTIARPTAGTRPRVARWTSTSSRTAGASGSSERAGHRFGRQHRPDHAVRRAVRADRHEATVGVGREQVDEALRVDGGLDRAAGLRPPRLAVAGRGPAPGAPRWRPGRAASPDPSARPRSTGR